MRPGSVTLGLPTHPDHLSWLFGTRVQWLYSELHPEDWAPHPLSPAQPTHSQKLILDAGICQSFVQSLTRAHDQVRVKAVRDSAHTAASATTTSLPPLTPSLGAKTVPQPKSGGREPQPLMCWLSYCSLHQTPTQTPNQIPGRVQHSLWTCSRHSHEIFANNNFLLKIEKMRLKCKPRTVNSNTRTASIFSTYLLLCYLGFGNCTNIFVLWSFLGQFFVWIHLQKLISGSTRAALHVS